MVSPQNIENWLQQQELEETEATNRRRKVYLQQRRLGDWIARIEASEEVPELDAIESVHLMMWHREKPLLVRQGDAFQEWRVPVLVRAEEPELFDDGESGTQGGEERVGRWLKVVAQERWGIGIDDWYQWGVQRLTATTRVEGVTPGTERFDVFLCATAGKLSDLAEDGEWSRRYTTTRDLNKLLRAQHLEFETTLTEVHSSYLIRQAQSARSGS